MRKILAVVLGVIVANVVFFLGSVAAQKSLREEQH